ncbi:glutamine dumper 5 [Euphorbia peplus]|nr:glutamine dumper 5 [Euphorbia peplus]
MNSTISSGGFGAKNGGFWHWNSPMPYLFGGLAAMLTIITVALIILACSYRKSSLSRSSEDEEKAPSKHLRFEVLDFEPKIVVIMAGDHNPTFFANPKPVVVPPNFSCNCQSQPLPEQV